MSWKDELLPASFRGVPFGVTSASSEFGRRLAVHEFPRRDVPYVEDLGRQARRFRVTGFVVGDDYMDQRDELIRVCEERIPQYILNTAGTLVHPYLGELLVACESLRVLEDAPRGGFARLEFVFVESGLLSLPAAGSDTAAAADNAAAAVGDAGEVNMADAVVTKGPESVRLATSTALRNLGETISKLDVFSGPADEVALLAADVASLIADATTLAVSPAVAAATVRNAVDGILNAAASFSTAWTAYAALFGWSIADVTIGGTGATGTAIDGNAEAVQLLTKQACAGGLARAGVRRTWEYRAQALAGRKVLSDALDELEDCADDAVCKALRDLRAAAISSIPPRGETLPELRTITLATATPALLVAYDLYQDPARAEEIAARNGAAHPGFLPAGVPLEVVIA